MDLKKGFENFLSNGRLRFIRKNRATVKYFKRRNHNWFFQFVGCIGLKPHLYYIFRNLQCIEHLHEI